MNIAKLISISLLLLTTNLIYSQQELSLEDIGEKITTQEALDLYGYDEQLLAMMDEVSSNKLYILKETPVTRYAFNSDEDYETFKSKNIVGLTIKTTKAKVDEMLKDLGTSNTNSQVYFKPLGMFRGGMLLIALNSNDLEDALKFEGFANSIFNMETKSFDPVSTEKLSKLLDEWKSKYDTQILSIGYDGLTLRINKVPDDRENFVDELNSICPDAISQVYMSEARMWKSIELQKMLSLWWD